MNDYFTERRECEVDFDCHPSQGCIPHMWSNGGQYNSGIGCWGISVCNQNYNTVYQNRLKLASDLKDLLETKKVLYDKCVLATKAYKEQQEAIASEVVIKAKDLLTEPEKCVEPLSVDVVE